MKQPRKEISHRQLRIAARPALQRRQRGVVHEASRQPPKRPRQLSQGRRRVRGDLALQAVPELGVARMPVAPDQRNRRAHVPCREGIGQEVLRRRLVGHHLRQLATSAAQPTGLLQRELVVVPVGTDGRPQRCPASGALFVGDAAGRDEVIVVGRRKLQVAVAHASLNVAGGPPTTDVEAGELPAGLKARIDEGLIDGHHLQRTDDLVAATRHGPGRACDPRQPEQVVSDERVAIGVAVGMRRLGDEVVPAERHNVAIAQPEAIVWRFPADVDQRAAGRGVADDARCRSWQCSSAVCCRQLS